MKTLIIIPTYNEADNIKELAKQIFNLKLDLDILVVDDGSPDGTAAEVEALQKQQPNLFLLKRQTKDGLGRAYLAGFAWAKAKNYEAVIQMDADFSHSPNHLPAMLAALATHDFVIGSRYVKGGDVVNWPLRRKLISRGGSLYARTILGLSIKDLTGGFNGWKMSLLDKFSEEVKSNGYCFQIEMKYRAVKTGASWQEVPITFEERRNGQSKLGGQIVWEAVWRVWQIRFKNLNWRFVGSLAAVLLATIITYWPSLHNQFITWDDNLQITENPDIQQLTPNSLAKIFSTFYVGMYQPVSSLTYALEYKLFGLNQFAFHSGSLLIHLINILLVVWLFKLLKQPNWLTLSAAAIFALHPMNVEAVAWASATSALLFSFWFLLATIFYLKYLDNNHRRYFWLSLLAFILSFLSKSAAIVFPFIILLCDYFKNKNLKNNWQEKIPFFLISALFAWVTFIGRGDADHITSGIIGYFNPGEMAALVFYALAFYAGKFFVPINLSAYYTYPIKNPGLPLKFYLIAGLTLAIIAYLFYLGRRHKLKKILIFGLWWYAINLLLVLKIVPLGSQLTADRYNYLPMLGTILFLGNAFNFESLKKISKKIGLAVLLLILLVFAYLSRQQTSLWQDSLTFFDRTARQAPTIGDLRFLRGYVKRQLGDNDGALTDLTKAIQLYGSQTSPNVAMAHNDRALLLSETFKKYDEALREIDVSIAIMPNFALFYYNRADIKILKKDFNGALTDLNKAIELNPQFKYFYNRANCYFELKQYQAAVADYTQAIKLKPKFEPAYFNRGLALFNLGQKQAACESVDSAANLGLKEAKNALTKLCH